MQPPKNQEDEGKTQFRDCCSLDLSDVEKEKRVLEGKLIIDGEAVFIRLVSVVT